MLLACQLAGLLTPVVDYAYRIKETQIPVARPNYRSDGPIFPPRERAAVRPEALNGVCDRSFLLLACPSNILTDEGKRDETRPKITKN
jgi:hypothetical protein